MEPVDATQMRSINSNLLLKIIYEKQEISRADIARLTGMSRSTVSTIVAELIGRRLVTEIGIGHSTVGRRPMMLSFDESAYSLLGIDLGATHIAVVLTNLKGVLRESRFRLCPVQSHPEQAIAILIETISNLIDHAQRSDYPVIGLGVGVPCPVNPDPQKSPMHDKILPAWRPYNLRHVLKARFQLPVYFENDANLGALAEHWWNDGQKVKNLAFVKIGTGIGAGLIIDGHIHRGRRGIAGELGHMVLGGAYETWDRASSNLNDHIGTRPLLQKFAELNQEFLGSQLAQSGSLTFERWLEALRLKDPAALKIFDEATYHLGLALVNILVLLDVDVVVLGGNFNESGHLLFDRLRQVIRQNTSWDGFEEVELRRSRFGDFHIAIGAATLVLEKALEDLRLFPLPRYDHAWHYGQNRIPAGHSSLA